MLQFRIKNDRTIDSSSLPLRTPSLILSYHHCLVPSAGSRSFLPHGSSSHEAGRFARSRSVFPKVEKARKAGENEKGGMAVSPPPLPRGEEGLKKILAPEVEDKIPTPEVEEKILCSKKFRS